MTENDNIAYTDMSIGTGYDVVDTHLCFADGKLFVYVQHGINTPPERKDVTEQVAKAIAKYIKEG